MVTYILTNWRFSVDIVRQRLLFSSGRTFNSNAKVVTISSLFEKTFHVVHLVFFQTNWLRYLIWIPGINEKQ